MKTSFPLLDLKLQYQTIKPELDEAVQRVMNSQQFILGPEGLKFENEVATFTTAKYAIGCASGSDALLLPLIALEVRPADEVITTPFTFVATAGSIARLGARPVFVDIDPTTFNLDPALLAKAITPKTKAIMPVHLFGMAADMDPIIRIAKETSIAVIEDAAQAIGAAYSGKQVGSIGLCAGFSFFPSKNLGGAGDGGLITTNDAAFADKLRLLRNHGSRTKYDYELLGTNSRLDELQAAILRVKLRHLLDWTNQRRRNAARYQELFTARALQRSISLPVVHTNCSHIYNQYVIRAPRRDDLRSHLTSCGVPSDIYYPKPLHLQPAFSYLGYNAGDFPHSESASSEVLALPIFPEMTLEQQKLVVDSIASFYQL